MKSPSISGQSLTEILVALLVLSAGVIGAAGLQLSAWQLTQQSAHQTAAFHLASEMAEWVQVFEDARLDDLVELSGEPGEGARIHCYARHCSAEDLTDFLLHHWQERVQTSFPDAKWRLCRDAAPWDKNAAAYRWSCSDGNEAAPLVIKIGWQDKQTLDKPLLPQIVLGTGR